MRIVVSGATKGIGRCIVELFAANGFDVAFCARNEIELKKFKQEIEKKYKVEALAKKADVSIKKDLDEFSAFILDKWDRIDVLVNNAGFFVSSEIHLEEEGLLEKMMETNLYSAYHLSRALIPGMQKFKSGHIFNIASIAGIQPCKNVGAYGISKFAMMGLNKALRLELQPYGIKVTAVIPGATNTASWDGIEITENRIIPPEDIAHLIWNAFKTSKQTVVEEILVRPILGDL